METTGAEFRKARESAGVTVRAAAAHVGITHSTLSRWERGERDISAQRVAKLLTALEDLTDPVAV